MNKCSNKHMDVTGNAQFWCMREQFITSEGVAPWGIDTHVEEFKAIMRGYTSRRMNIQGGINGHVIRFLREENKMVHFLSNNVFFFAGINTVHIHYLLYGIHSVVSSLCKAVAS